MQVLQIQIIILAIILAAGIGLTLAELRQIAALLEKMGDILTDQLSAVLDELRKDKND